MLNPIINFVVYEVIIDRLRVKRSASTLQIFVASSIGKLLATFATYPILTIRVRMQANKDKAKADWMAKVRRGEYGDEILAEQTKYEQVFENNRAKNVIDRKKAEDTWLKFYGTPLNPKG